MPDSRRRREIVSIERVVRTVGGKMRPIERVYNSCTLSCGHVQEKLKVVGAAPPVRMYCRICEVE